MKRIFLFCLVPLLLFGACERSAATVPTADISAAVLHSLPGEADFVLTDSGYAHESLALEGEYEGIIYLYQKDGAMAEFGVFLVGEGENPRVVADAVRTYLFRECEGMRGLAHLYPGNTLEENLSRYENADIVQNGRYVYYFALDENEKKAAKEAAANTVSGK